MLVQFPPLFQNNKLEFGVVLSLDCMYGMSLLPPLLHQPVIVSMCHVTGRPSSPIMFLRGNNTKAMASRITLT